MMVEAQIICTCVSIWIADLNLDMKKGQAAIVSETAAKNSKDLAQARKNGGVQVTYIERFKELRSPVEQSTPVKPVQKMVLPQPPPTKPQVRVEKISLDEDALADKVAARMNAMRDNSTNDLISSLIAKVEQMQNSLKERPQIVREIVGSGGKVETKEDVPMFIPEKIMGKDRDIDLEIEETTSEGTVDEASEALRALRKKKQEK